MPGRLLAIHKQFISWIFITFLIPSFSLASPDITLQGQPLRHLTAKTSLNGSTPQPLSPQTFFQLSNSSSLSMGTWLGLITHLQTDNPQVHIIDETFYSDVHKLGFRLTYGTHEGYARKHGFADNSDDYIRKVLGRGNKKQLMPFTLHIPLQRPIKQDGKAINWVFQNRRYKYQDSNRDFANALIKSKEAVKKHLLSDFPGFKNAFITYNKLGSRRPNLQTTRGRQDIKRLKQSGYPILTEQELETAAGIEPQQVYIMNTGALQEDNHSVAYGVLRHITELAEGTSRANSINSLSPQDIALFDALPERIPPVAGIIVLEKQTALSHVNILAKNRGTINISLHSLDPQKPTNSTAFLREQLQGFSTELYGKPVKLSIENESIHLTQSTPEAVEQFYQRRQAAKNTQAIEKPIVFDKNRWLLNPAKENLQVKHVGAKAANYGLIQNWLKETDLVMPGRAIGFNLYLQTILINTDKGQARTLITQLLKDKAQLSHQEINQRLTAIQEAIKAVPLEQMPVTATGISIADELQTLLASDYKHVGRIRFRSSTNAEDLPTFNGAGLYESKGFTVNKLDENGKRVINKEKMWKKLKPVFASLWLPRAFHEREYFGIDHTNVAMAIQINPAFSDKWLNGVDLYEWGNGVILYDEKNGQKTWQINSQYGEASVTNPLPGELPESLSIVNDQLKSVKGRATIQGTVHEIFVDRSNDQLKADTLALLQQLQLGTQTIFKHKILQHPDEDFRNPEQFGIDIEFKIMFNRNTGEKELYIKQARPLAL